MEGDILAQIVMNIKLERIHYLAKNVSSYLSSVHTDEQMDEQLQEIILLSNTSDGEEDEE